MSRAILSLLSTAVVTQAGQAQFGSITEVAGDNGATVFRDFVTCTGNAATVNGLKGYTVFVPSNLAFLDFLGRAGIDPADACDVPQPLAFQILEYHVVPSVLFSNNPIFQDNLSPETIVPGARLVLAGGTMVNQASIDTNNVDLVADINNVLHIVSSVLISPTIFASSALVQTLNPVNTRRFFELLACTTISLGATQTILVPSNQALDVVPVQPNCASYDQAELTRILSYHIIPDNVVYSWLLPNNGGAYQTAYNGNNVLWDGSQFGSAASFVNVIEPNVPHNGATTTLLHVIDGVLSLPRDVVSTVTDPTLSQQLSIVTGAIVCTGLNAVVDTLGPVTFMLPINQAFLDLGVNDPCTQIPLDDLRDILLYHVAVGASVYSFDITASGTGPPTLQGESWSITVGLNGIQINDANVISPDWLVNPDAPKPTGVIHIIDRVLSPYCEGICGKDAKCNNALGQCEADCNSECCTPGGCNDQAIQSCVCKIDPWCCLPNPPERWDQQCAEEAVQLCGLSCS